MNTVLVGGARLVLSSLRCDRTSVRSVLRVPKQQTTCKIKNQNSANSQQIHTIVG